MRTAAALTAHTVGTVRRHFEIPINSAFFKLRVINLNFIKHLRYSKLKHARNLDESSVAKYKIVTI